MEIAEIDRVVLDLVECSPSEVHKSCAFQVNNVRLLIESMFDGVIRSEGIIIQDRGHGSPGFTRV